MLAAWECGYRRLIIESDCLPLIQKLKKSKTQNSALGLVLEDISYLVSLFGFCSFSFVKREGNVLAHSIAKYHFDGNREMYWLEDFPDFALDLASRDMLSFINNN
ncbi:DNA-directed RNA polymerase subunit alpha [Bienertia sinuspersici]